MHEFSLQSDQELLKLLHEGNSEAFEKIYRRYWDKLYNQAYKRIAEKQPVEDILQNVFTRLWKRRSETSIDNLPAYLSTSVKYEVIRFLTNDKNASHFYEPFNDALREASTAEGKLIEKELLNIIYKYAESLSDRKKEIFLLYFQSHHNTKEIADIMNISRKTVQNQLRTVLSDLKKKIIPILFSILASKL